MADIKVEIKDLPSTMTQARTDFVPTQKAGGASVKQSIAQILGLLSGSEVANALSTGTVDDTFDDADKVVYLTGTNLKLGALSGLIASIFKTTRTIASAQFAAASFKLFNAAGTPRALSFITTALTADRNVTVPDRDVNLGLVPIAAPYVSSDLTITSGGAISLTHGLPTPPTKVFVSLVCQTAEGGYSVGDVIPLGYVGYVASSVAIGIGIAIGSTTIDGRYSSGTNVFFYPRKDTGAQISLTNANWKMRLRAEL